MRIPQALLLALMAISTACETTQTSSAGQGPELPLTARGQEPGWLLKVDRDQLALEYQYGQKSFSAPTPKPQSIPDGWRYSVTSNDQLIALDIKHRYCTDAMSGMPYPYTAEVTIDDETLKGCGGDSKSLLTGAEWQVQKIDNEKVIGEARITLHFTDDGKLHGRTGCNLYNGGYQMTGEGISIRALSQTRMTCTPSIMKQEQTLLNVLQTVERFRIDDAGALVLEVADNRTLKAQRL